MCTLLQAVTSTRPEVARHLLAAGRELALALQAAADWHADESAHTGERLERIDLE